MWQIHIAVDPKGLRRILLVLVLVGLFIPAGLAGAAPNYVISVPQVVSYQGQITVNGQPFSGSGYFKFALVDQAGKTSYWSNDGASSAGSEPKSAVMLAVNKGLFSVLLGDTTISNMTQPLSAAAFSGPRYLRIWFSQDGQSFQQLAPDRLIATVPYALTAAIAQEANHALSAATAQEASHALSADNAKEANHALSADNAKEANHALSADSAKEATHAASATNADTLDGKHAADLEMPSGSVVMGMPGDQRLAGFRMLGISNVACMSCSSFEGNWGAELPTYSTPSSRYWNSSVWTGQEIIIWGGSESGVPLNTGARYNPITNIWTPITTDNAPSPRYAHTAVWTGSEMIIWGGKDLNGQLNTGARYNPATDSWRTMSIDSAPSARRDHRAVWTGKEMIIWGGKGAAYLDDGAKYNPSDDTWTLIPSDPAITGRMQHTMEWTGSEMCVWGGTNGGNGSYYRNDGACYDPAKTVSPWTPIPTAGAPSARVDHTSIWTGHEMIIWGGENSQGNFENTGARYDPVAGIWTGITTNGAPGARTTHTAVWTGSEMIIWGGVGSTYLNDGARYSPTTGIWTKVSQAGSPTARSGHMAVWTGGGSSGLGEMIIYGGFNENPLDTGGRYNLFLNLYQKP